MAIASLREETPIGVDLFVVVPSPSWPKLFRPQHETLQSEMRAQVENAPVVMRVALVSVDTKTGTSLSEFEPSPICP